MKKWRCGVLLPMVLLLSGCLDPHSLDRYGYVLAIGVDPGQEKSYKMTLMLQNRQLSENNQKSEGFTLVSAECEDLYEAIDTLSSSLPYTLDFSRTMMLMFAQELLREEGTLEKLIDISFAKLHIRYNANVYAARSDAEMVLKGMENDLEPNPSKMQTNHMLYARSTGYVPVTNLTMLLEGIDQSYEDAILPLCSHASKDQLTLVDSELKMDLAGAALLCGSRMVGLCSGEDTQRLLMARGEFQEGRIHVKEGGMSLIAAAVSAPTVKLSLGEEPRAHVTIRLRATLERPHRASAADLETVSKRLSAQLEEELRTMFLGCRAIGSDAMGFGRYAVRQFSDAEAWKSYDWRAAYARLNAAFTVVVEMEQTSERSVLE